MTSHGAVRLSPVEASLRLLTIYKQTNKNKKKKQEQQHQNESSKWKISRRNGILICVKKR